MFGQSLKRHRWKRDLIAHHRKGTPEGHLALGEGLQLPVNVLGHSEAIQDGSELDIAVNDALLQHGMQRRCTGQSEVTCNTTLCSCLLQCVNAPPFAVLASNAFCSQLLRSHPELLSTPALSHQRSKRKQLLMVFELQICTKGKMWCLQL